MKLKSLIFILVIVVLLPLQRAASQADMQALPDCDADSLYPNLVSVRIRNPTTMFGVRCCINP